MANDWTKTPLVEPQAVLAGRQIVAGDFSDMPGNLNYGMASPVLSLMDLRVPDAEVPLATFNGAGVGAWSDLFSGDMRIPSPSPDAALFDVRITVRATVAGVIGAMRAVLASGPTQTIVAAIGGPTDFVITVGDVAAPYDDLMVELSGAVGCTIEVHGVAVEYVALADPLPAGVDFGGDEVALDVATIAADEPLDSALLAALKADLSLLYAMPKPIYFRVGFNAALSGQDALEAPHAAANGVMRINRVGFPPSVGAGEKVQVWLRARNNSAVAKEPRVYYGPADRWPALGVAFSIPGLTTVTKLAELPARERLDIGSFDWPMAELGIRSFEDVDVLGVFAWAA